MAPGDLLVLFTDGLTEAHDPTRGEEFGEDRLVEVVLAQRTLSPQAVVDAVFAAVAEFTGDTAPEDDKTMIVVKRRALPG
jgi:sigma-B regulation protein RsbU (phosphoserine phosphatase)